MCASVGSWITLTECDETDDEYCDIITRVKTELVDGVEINGDTWYTLSEANSLRLKRTRILLLNTKIFLKHEHNKRWRYS